MYSPAVAAFCVILMFEGGTKIPSPLPETKRMT